MLEILFLSTDTEGSFIVERVVDIAQSAIQHIKGVAEGSNDAGMKELQWEEGWREREREKGKFLHLTSVITLLQECWSHPASSHWKPFSLEYTTTVVMTTWSWWL